MNYIEKFNLFFEKISNHPLISCNELKKLTDDKDQNLIIFIELENEKDYNFDPSFLDAISISSEEPHLRFWYDYKDKNGGKRNGGGEFQLESLDFVLLHAEDPKLWHDEMEEKDIKFMKTLRIIDDHPDSGDFRLAAFSVQEGINPPSIPQIYFYDRGEYYLMNLDYNGYLDALLDLIGIGGWQYLFCSIDMNIPKFKYLYNELSEMLEDLKVLFPEKDYTKYDKMLADKIK